MARIGLSLGLTALAYALFGFEIVRALSEGLGLMRWKAMMLLTLGVFGVLAWLSAPLLLGRKGDRPQSLPAPATYALAIAAALYLILYFAREWLIIRGFSVGRVDVLALVSTLALWTAIVLSVGLLPRRASFFLGVLALAWRLDIGAILGFSQPGGPSYSPPQESLPWLTPIAALAIAWQMSAFKSSPADRVRQPRFLFAFGAIGALTVAFLLTPGHIGHEGLSIPDLPYPIVYAALTSLLICLLPLGAFLALVSDLRPPDGSTRDETSRAGWLLLLSVFAGLSVVLGTVFKVVDVLRLNWAFRSWFSTSHSSLWSVLACPAVATAVMFWMRFPARVPRNVPGTRLLFAGLLLMVLVYLLTLPIAPLSSPLSWYFVAGLLAPIVHAGTALVGIGILRVMFNLQAAPGSTAEAAFETPAPVASVAGGIRT